MEALENETNPTPVPIPTEVNLFELHRQEQSVCQPEAVARRLLVQSMEILRNSKLPLLMLLL
jgi:hypothetical protein